MKPIIALTSYGRYEKDLSNPWYKEHFSLPALYIDALRRAGGIPLLIPPGEKDIAAILSIVNSVIVTGGADIHPSIYGGNSEHPQLTDFDRERDTLELALVHHLLEVPKIPSLYICRGMQILNIALGGTLHEHVADAIPEDIHRGDDGVWRMHGVRIKPKTLAASVMGSEEISTTSGHHQAIKELASDLKISATAPDGVIEAVEHKSAPWMLGVQWHPEITAKEDPTQQRLFDALVKEAMK
ncbi:MAG: gamma-glutamyl-gamma-aminobutyrate hydrolase family protein [Chloroflexi bacterium]|nr:gamma-glutamyl-gamma-aminobutyrate hydrolase family protein [Chloroflexota bacterium]